MRLRRKTKKTRKRKSGGSKKTPSSSTKRKAAKKIQNKVRTRRNKRSTAATKVQSLARMLKGKRLANQEKDIDDEIQFLRDRLSKSKYDYASSSDDSEEAREIKWMRRTR